MRWFRRRRPSPPPSRLELLDRAFVALDEVWHHAVQDRRGLPDDFFLEINEVQSRLMEAWENEAHRQQVGAQWAQDWDSKEDARHDR